MKLRVALMVVLCLAVVLVQDSPVALAQGDAPPVVDILGRPDTLSHPPLAFLAVSVVDRKSGRIIEGLDASNSRVSEEAVEPTVKLNSTGLAAVMVIDRGGIARSNDPRRGHAVDLASTLLGLLSLNGSPNASASVVRTREVSPRLCSSPTTTRSRSATSSMLFGLRLLMKPRPFMRGSTALSHGLLRIQTRPSRISWRIGGASFLSSQMASTGTSAMSRTRR